MISLKKKSHLILAIALFVILDMGTLFFNFTISYIVEKDAVAINLSGRQRMLSQKTTKAALLTVFPHLPEEDRQKAITEASQAYSLFYTTLKAFAQGGTVEGGNGVPVVLDPVEGKALELVQATIELVSDWHKVPVSSLKMGDFTHYMVQNNQAILNNMNELTTELQQQSIQAVSKLRIAQTLAFSLSLINLVFILIGMRKAQLEAERESVTDALTGLTNRAGIYKALERQLARYLEEKTPLGVLLLDLNGFKSINDSQGHAAGDQLLIEVGRHLKNANPLWIPGRLGGDEFAIICPDTPSGDLAESALALKASLSEIRSGDLFISASIGWASAFAHSTPDSLIGHADMMMYADKGEQHRSPVKNARKQPRA